MSDWQKHLQAALGFLELGMLDEAVGEIEATAPEREEAAHQLVTHAAEMEKFYGKRWRVVIVIAGDFNTDPPDPQFAVDNTLGIFREGGFQWAWEDVPRESRVTIPSKGKYPDASFDGFVVKGAAAAASEVLREGSVSDHYPVLLRLVVP